jgi:hypothetical protein
MMPTRAFRQRPPAIGADRASPLSQIGRRLRAEPFHPSASDRLLPKQAGLSNFLGLASSHSGEDSTIP